jgi:hypothetical protein
MATTTKTNCGRCPVCGNPMPRQQQSRRVAFNGLVVCDRATCETRADEYRFRIVATSIPAEVDSDGYDTYAAADGMAAANIEGEYRIEAYR